MYINKYIIIVTISVHNDLGVVMEAGARIEIALEAAVAPNLDNSVANSSLSRAIWYAVFPGGARVRPQLCLAVAAACGDHAPDLTDAAAAAIELLHCGSLVHDDLPCFDDAEMRRGKASVHTAFGEATAVLTGDALIVLAFQCLARAPANHADQIASLIVTLSEAVGVPRGIIAGQAMECEDTICVSEYHRAKTGALFSGATMSGAISAGDNPERWRLLGEKIGEAYQVADDILDTIGNAEKLGKPSRKDSQLSRPNSVDELGLVDAERELNRLLSDALDSIPKCPGSGQLRSIIEIHSKRLAPKRLAEYAA